jgi:hypothetical protein
VQNFVANAAGVLQGCVVRTLAAVKADMTEDDRFTLFATALNPHLYIVCGLVSWARHERKQRTAKGEGGSLTLQMVNANAGFITILYLVCLNTLLFVSQLVPLCGNQTYIWFN